MNRIINIAIDGPSGSGKSTLASAIAKHYGFIYIDTGALYRTVGLYIQRKGFASDDKENIVAALRKLPECANAAIIGEVTADHPGKVVMTTSIGTQTMLPRPGGELLPRIC